MGHKITIFFKIMLLLLVFMLLVAVLSIEVCPRLNSMLYTSSSSIESRTWMSQIDDQVLISEIVIPGAHNATTKNVLLAAFSKCQNEDVYSLLNSGFRYLDIRLGIDVNNGDLQYNLYHNFLKCLQGSNIWNKPLTFNIVMDNCVQFLKDNPSETVLLVVKKEHGDISVSDFESYLNDCLSAYGDSVLLTDSVPTMGQSRGKVVLFRRYEDEACLKNKSGIPLSWVNQGNIEIAPCAYELNGDNTSKFYVQDRYNYDTEDKWIAFCETMEATDVLNKSGPVINFLSTSGSPEFDFPLKYAKDLNKLFLENYSNKRVSGWIIVDFGNYDLAKTIYSSNFIS